MVFFVVAFLAYAFVAAMIGLMLAAMVWMFTTALGLVVLGLFVLGVLINFFAPNDNEFMDGDDG